MRRGLKGGIRARREEEELHSPGPLGSIPLQVEEYWSRVPPSPGKSRQLFIQGLACEDKSLLYMLPEKWAKY